MHCIVVGGGAAGMMAAVSAASEGARVTLIEHNEKLGKKLYITGKGRCNITNHNCPENFFENVVSNPKFLFSSFNAFDSTAVEQFFEDRGLELKVERGGRVFPVSDHSSDVIAGLAGALKELGVEILLNTEVKGLITSPVNEEPCIRALKLKDGREISCDSVVMATGGLSYPSTGSTGMGHKMLKELGHTITALTPALVPVTVEEEWIKELQGLTLKNVEIVLRDMDKAGKKGEIYRGRGEMLFAHFGLTGPLILTASSYYVKNRPVHTKLKIDLKPALTQEQLDKRLQRDFRENNNRLFKNALGGLLPAKLIPVIIRLSGISPTKQVNNIAAAERKTLVDIIKNLTLRVTGTRDYNEAIITGGGVKVKEINPNTMKSKLYKNLYLAGELLDLDALTGGYNLQIAWSTGYLAGKNAGKTERENEYSD